MRLLLFLLICLPFISRAQVDASFTVSATSGCVPLMVQITNGSNGATSWSWNFGNGQTSTLENPWAVNYLLPGNYTITLTVTNGTQSDVATQVIQVFAKPTADFSYIGTAEGCIPIDLIFVDESTPGSAPIVGWDWEFGDGYSSTQQGPQHTYNQPGVFGVLLTVTDTNGCSGSMLIDPVVRGSNEPLIQISANPTNHCIVPLDVQFTNTSNGTQPLSFLWDFGDGTDTTVQSPLHTYTTLGVYTVSLTVTDPYGCSSDTVLTDYIDITDVTASFTTSTGNMTVCPNQAFQFINTSGNSSVFWEFGTGSTSLLPEPWMIYPNDSIYNVTLIAGYGMPCADTIVVPITVQDVQSSVLINPSGGYNCQLPTTFNLSYSGATPVTGYAWTIQTPSGTVNSTSSSANAQITQNGSFPFELIVTTQYGCKDTVKDTLSIDAITTNIYIDTLAEGCIPYPVGFSSTTHSNEPIASWEWNFGDPYSGLLNTSTDSLPTHIFDSAGVFIVTLIITNDSNCVDTAYGLINTGPHHYPNFEICFLQDPLTIDTCKRCPRDSILFTNLTTDTLWNPVDENDPLYEWSWFFGSTDFEPEEMLDDYFAPLDTGWQYDLWMICNYNGCRDTVHLDPDSTLLDSIGLYLWAPLIRSMTDSMSCDSTYKRWFFADIFEADHWDWDFGDTTFLLNSTEDTVIHTYDSIGMYWIKLYAYSDSTSCVFKDSIQIRITDIIASFTPLADTICFNTAIVFDASASQDAVQYSWTVFNTIPAGGNMIQSIGPYNQVGIMPVQLIATDMYGCTDTLEAEVTVAQPVADFIADTLIGCSPFSVEFYSLSTSDMGLANWSWQFGDGQSSIGQDTVSNTYTSPPGITNYNVQLVVTDSLGCSSAVTKPMYISVYRVEANLFYIDNYVCLGTSVQFLNWSVGAQLTYLWDFGNGTTNTVFEPNVLYTDSGQYTVTIIATDTLGCVDTLVRPNVIEVQEAIADFTVNSTDTTCYPFTPAITNLSPIGFGPVYEWDFGDGFVAASRTPSHSYSLPGDYWLTYTITTSDGCTDKDSVFIHVGGPYAVLNVFPDSICKGEEVTFYLTDTMNIQTVNWNFGDGYGSNQDSTSHTYAFVPPNGEFYVSLIYFSDSLCDKAAEPDTINVEEVIAGFGIVNSVTLLPDLENCPPFTLTFPNTSTGATSWYWDLGNGQVYTGNTPSDVVYVNPTSSDSIYTITQIIQSDLGCTDTLRQDITVWATPTITVSNDTIICVGDTAFLNATGGNTVLWSPNLFLSDTDSYNPDALPNTSMYYYVLIKDSNDCRNNDSVYVYVQQQPNIFHSNDTSIVIGESVILYVTADQPFTTFTWSPPYALSDTMGSPVTARPFESTTYTIVIVDSMGCFEIFEDVYIEVIENYSLDMPTVFSPNGDNANEKVYVRGWGLKQLLEFSIYNRWGERIYFSDDLLEGWDGTYNGKPQSIDTYTYYVKVVTFADRYLEKKGNITLLR